MDTSTTTGGARKHRHWDFLVKVSGNSLKLNEDAVKLVGAADPVNIPVVILSVVGQPKSRKTSVMNEIIRHFEKLCRPFIPLPRCTFPLNSEDNPGYPDIDGQEGILVWQYPELVARSDGTMTTFLFMDIWTENPRAIVYSKLVDFCLNLSSTVIFSEPCDSNPDVYWQACDTDNTNFRNSLRMHFFLLTQETMPELYVMSEGPLWIEKSTAECMKKIVAITCQEAFLSSRYKRITSTFVPLHETNDDASANPVELDSELAKKILTDCIDNPAEINNATVNMSTIHSWLEQSILALNGATVSSQIVDSNARGTIRRDSESPVVVDASIQNPEPSYERYYGEEERYERNLPIPTDKPSCDFQLTDDEDVEMIEVEENKSFHHSQSKEKPMEFTNNIGDELASSQSQNIYGQNEPSAHSSSKVLVSEEKGSYRALTKSKVPPEEPAGSKTATILFEISEYYVNNFKDIFGRIPDTQAYFLDAELMTHHDNLAQEILLAYPGDQARMGELRAALMRELPQWFSEFRDLNEARRAEYDHLLSITNEEVNCVLDNIAEQLRTELSTNPSNFAFKYDPEYFQVIYQKMTNGIPERLKKPVADVLVTAKADLQTTMSRMNAMMHTYVQNLTKHSRDNICFDPRRFEDVDQESLMTAKSSTKYTDSGRKTLDDLCKKAVENLMNNFKEQNKFIYSKEEEISGDAHKHAVQNYRDFMDHKILSSALTEMDLHRLHQFATETISALFLKALPGQQTQPWNDQQLRLREFLESLLTDYEKKRQNYLKRVESAKRDGFSAGKSRYQDIMEKCLPETRVTDGNFVDYHNRAENQALEVMRGKAKSNDVHHDIWKQWDEEFKASLSVLRQRFAIRNLDKKEKSGSYLAATKEAVPGRPALVQQPPVFHSQTKPYGLGIYIAPKQVRVGVYVSQGVNFEDNITMDEPPMITFTQGRVSIGKEASSDFLAGAPLCYNIFDVLDTHTNIDIEAHIEGMTRRIGQEEILSIFFHRIRMNTEIILKQKVNSCYVAVTGLLSSGAKQMLKTSMTIAGFTKNTLIPCTTAMAMSYILKSQGQGPASKNSHSHVLLAYATSKLVEVASADVTGEEAHLQTLSGDSNIYGRFHPSVWEQVKIATKLSDETKLLLQKRMKYVLESVISTGKDYKAVVVCCGKDLGPLLPALCNELMKHCPSQSLTNFHTNNDILKVAAALDAIRKQHPDLLSSKVRFPAYHNISPHRMTVKYNKKFRTFVDFNSKTPIQENSVVKAGCAEITLYEKARDSQNEWEVAEYSLQITSQPNTHLVLNLSQEGNLTVGTNPKGLPVATNARSLVGSQCQLILDSIKPMLDALEKRYGFKLLVAEDQQYKAAGGESTPVFMVSTERRHSIEELLRSLKALVEKVKLELEKSKTTSVTVRENIVLKITKCEEFLKMNAVDVNVKRLELDMNNLRVAAKLIKT